MEIRFLPFDPKFVADVRSGAPDAYGRVAERAVSDGNGVPCRSCLRDVPAGAAYLIVAARPFADLHPYTETGPIFLCAEECRPWTGNSVPPILKSSPNYIARGYSDDGRIVYGTGQVVASETLSGYAAQLLDDPDIAHVDIRSARNNCFQTRAVRVDA
ncbi:MAG: DUF1203 domain-containing protein [Pseudomonadota bacterium]